MAAERSVVDKVLEKVTAAGPAVALSEHDRARCRAADLIRQLTGCLVIAEADAGRLGRASEFIERAIGELAESDGRPGRRFDRNPVIGKANPVAPPMTMWIEPDRIAGTVIFGSQYQGPPGSVHGGFVAALLDEILASAQVLSGVAGMTGTMMVRYLRPTPVNVALDVEAHVEWTEGRKVFTSGRCSHSGVVTAEAEAVFVVVDEANFGVDAGGEPAGGGCDGHGRT